MAPEATETAQERTQRHEVPTPAATRNPAPAPPQPRREAIRWVKPARLVSGIYGWAR